jgi:hypothetical protein
LHYPSAVPIATAATAVSPSAPTNNTSAYCAMNNNNCSNNNGMGDDQAMMNKINKDNEYSSYYVPSNNNRRTNKCYELDRNAMMANKEHEIVSKQEARLFQLTKNFIDLEEEIERHDEAMEREERRETRAHIERLTSPETMQLAIKAEMERSHHIYISRQERRKMRQTAQSDLRQDIARQRKNTFTIKVLQITAGLVLAVSMLSTVRSWRVGPKQSSAPKVANKIRL